MSVDNADDSPEDKSTIPAASADGTVYVREAKGPLSTLQRSLHFTEKTWQSIVRTFSVTALIQDASSKNYRLWWLGMLTCLVGCLSSATGLLLMKQSGATESHLPLYRRFKWVSGFMFLIVNASIIDMIAYSFTPLALMAPFSGVTIVFSTLLAQCGCCGGKEVITTWQWVSILIVCTGIALISVYGPRSSEELNENNINAHLFRLRFKIFAAFSAVAVTASLALWKCKEDRSQLSVVVFAIGSSTSGAISQLSLKVLSNSLRDYFYGYHHFFSLPMCIGISGMVLSAPPQLLLLNSALVNSPVAFGVPLYQTMLIISTIVAGGVFFDEFDLFSTDWVAAFSTGVAVAIAGLVALGTSAKPDKAAEFAHEEQGSSTLDKS